MSDETQEISWDEATRAVSSAQSRSHARARCQRSMAERILICAGVTHTEPARQAWLENASSVQVRARAERIDRLSCLC